MSGNSGLITEFDLNRTGKNYTIYWWTVFMALCYGVQHTLEMQFKGKGWPRNWGFILFDWTLAFYKPIKKINFWFTLGECSTIRPFKFEGFTLKHSFGFYHLSFFQTKMLLRQRKFRHFDAMLEQQWTMNLRWFLT